jgi:IS30 family transposase
MKRGRLSEAEKREIERLAGKGQKSGQIALNLRRHPATVGWAMTCMGLRQPIERAFSYTRNGREVRSFSADEDALMEELAITGKKNREIAEICSARFGHKRSTHTIRARLIMLSAREVADA